MAPSIPTDDHTNRIHPSKERGTIMENGSKNIVKVVRSAVISTVAIAGLTVGIANAADGPAARLRGKVIIGENIVTDARIKGGTEADVDVLGIAGGGGRHGTAKAETTLQSISFPASMRSDAEIMIVGNRISKFSNAGAMVTIQSVKAR